MKRVCQTSATAATLLLAAGTVEAANVKVMSKSRKMASCSRSDGPCANGALQAREGRIENASGQPFQAKGMSLFWHMMTWGGEHWTAETVQHLREEFGANLVRAAIGTDADYDYINGTEPVGTYRHRTYYDDPAWAIKNAELIVDAAIANDMYVIVDWHSHWATRNNKHISNAVEFFTHMAQKYADKPHVIWETWNEPVWPKYWSYGHHPPRSPAGTNINGLSIFNLTYGGAPHYKYPDDYADASLAGKGSDKDYGGKGVEEPGYEGDWRRVLKPYHEYMLSVIRGQGATQLAVLGTPSWSQRVDHACNYPVEDATNANGKNVAYTLHFYSGTFSHQAALREYANTAMSGKNCGGPVEKVQKAGDPETANCEFPSTRMHKNGTVIEENKGYDHEWRDPYVPIGGFQNLENNKCAVFITEYGVSDANGDTLKDEDTGLRLPIQWEAAKDWLKFVNGEGDNKAGIKLSSAAWSVHDAEESSAAFQHPGSVAKGYQLSTAGMIYKHCFIQDHSDCYAATSLADLPAITIQDEVADTCTDGVKNVDCTHTRCCAKWYQKCYVKQTENGNPTFAKCWGDASIEGVPEEEKCPTGKSDWEWAGGDDAYNAGTMYPWMIQQYNEKTEAERVDLKEDKWDCTDAPEKSTGSGADNTPVKGEWDECGNDKGCCAAELGCYKTASGDWGYSAACMQHTNAQAIEEVEDCGADSSSSNSGGNTPVSTNNPGYDNDTKCTAASPGSVPENGGCSATDCCADGFKCYKQNDHWSQCKADCPAQSDWWCHTTAGSAPAAPTTTTTAPTAASTTAPTTASTTAPTAAPTTASTTSKATTNAPSGGGDYPNCNKSNIQAHQNCAEHGDCPAGGPLHPTVTTAPRGACVADHVCVYQNEWYSGCTPQ